MEAGCAQKQAIRPQAEDSGHHPSPEGLTAVLCGLGAGPGQKLSQARISRSLRLAHGNCIVASLFWIVMSSGSLPIRCYPHGDQIK